MAARVFRSAVTSACRCESKQFRFNPVGTICHVIYHRRWAWPRSCQRSINQRNHFLLGSSYV